MATRGIVLFVCIPALFASACADDRRRGGGAEQTDVGPLVVVDAGQRDVGSVADAEIDAAFASHDTGIGSMDAGLGAIDAGRRDSGSRDAGARDAGSRDAGARDAGSRDAGARDAGSRDAGARDAGSRDAGARDAGSRDAGPHVPGDCSSGVTKYFLASVLAPAMFAPGSLPGFNLDGRTSDALDTLTCLHADGSNATESGVDNVYGQSFELESISPFTETLSSNIESGDLLLLVRLDHVDSLLNDECVQVSIVTGLLPAGVALRLGRSGLPAIDQTFDLDAESFETDGVTPRAQVEDASIVGGHIRVSPLDVDLSLVPSTHGVLSLTDSVVEFDVNASRLSNLVIGGGVQAESFARAFGSMSGVEIPTIVSFLRSYTDLDYNHATGQCDSMSMVLAGEGVRALSSGLVVSR